MEIVLNLSEEESVQLYDIIDIATKAGGLQVAKVSVPLVSKLIQAIDSAKSKSEE